MEMTSPDIESSFSANPYPEITLTSPQAARPRSPRNPASDRRTRPRLPSPHLFRDFFEVETLQSAPRYAERFDLPPISFEETMNNVNRALQSANRAIQTAQEAFQTRRSHSNQTQGIQEVVDLTGTSPPPTTGSMAAMMSPASSDQDAAYEEFFSRFDHPHNSTSRNLGIHGHLNEALYGANPGIEEDPTARYSGPDSQTGPRRRYENQRRSHIHVPAMHRMFVRSGGAGSRATDEDGAMRRQQRARAQWEQSQRNTSERLRLEEQRQRLLNSPTSTRNATLASNAARPASLTRRSSSVSSLASVEAVDLTQVDDDSSLAAALSKQRQDAISSQNNTTSQNKTSNSGIGSEGGRTPLTAYKCPICMEPPQSATTTACGHLFCHKCIIDTLKWSEQARRDEAPPSRRVKGVCPVCRKELARKEEPGNGRTLIPLELRLLTRKEMKRKREKQHRKNQAESKGKEKVYDICDYDDNTYDSTGKIKVEGSSQKENRDIKKQKIKDSQSDRDEMDSLFDFGGLDDDVS